MKFYLLTPNKAQQSGCHGMCIPHFECLGGLALHPGS